MSNNARSLLLLWNPIRTVLFEYEYFERDIQQIRTILAASTVPHNLLVHAEYLGDLLEACDYYFRETNGDTEESLKDKKRAVEHLYQEVLKAVKDRDEPPFYPLLKKLRERLEEVAGRFHYGIMGATLVPIEFQITCELSELPERALASLQKSISRYRDGDLDGAMTSICTAIDDACREIAGQDDPEWNGHNYQKKVLKAWHVRAEVVRSVLALEESDEKRSLDAHKRAVNGSAEVLQGFRLKYADVHGVNDAPQGLVSLAFDHAVFLLRALTSPIVK